MSEGVSSTANAAVPEDVRQSLLSDSSEQGHVTEKKSGLEENIRLEDAGELVKPKGNDRFVGLTKEELKCYINNPKWKRIRWIVAILYLLVLVALLVGSILLVTFSSRCPPKPKLNWYEKNVIYEVDLTRFKDSNDDGIGDLQGFQSQLQYLEKNHIKSFLFGSSIFDASVNQQIDLKKRIDLQSIDPLVATENQLANLIKSFNRKDFNLIIDLPLASTFDPNGTDWYGSDQPLKKKISNPCTQNPTGVACRFYQSYGYLPLNFNSATILNQSLSRINYWLATKKFDGIRVNLPLAFKNATKSYGISLKTIDQWINAVREIEKKSKPKLLLFDVPFGLEDLVSERKLNERTAFPLLNTHETSVNARDLVQRFNQFNENNSTKPKFWKLGSTRRTDEIAILNPNQLSREIVLALTMLLGGTPVVLYGEEINLNQRENPLMSWRPGRLFQGFSNCSSAECLQKYQHRLANTSVQREEAAGQSKAQSLLNVFRYLSKLRQKESFQFGLLKYDFDETTNTFWFIREASGHPGYVVILNLNGADRDQSHISPYELALGDVPSHIHCEYQWPIVHIPISNTTHVNSDNLLIDAQSINIFSWATKTMKPEVLKSKFEQHSREHHHHHEHE